MFFICTPSRASINLIDNLPAMALLIEIKVTEMKKGKQNFSDIELILPVREKDG